MPSILIFSLVVAGVGVVFVGEFVFAVGFVIVGFLWCLEGAGAAGPAFDGDA